MSSFLVVPNAVDSVLRPELHEAVGGKLGWFERCSSSTSIGSATARMLIRSTVGICPEQAVLLLEYLHVHKCKIVILAVANIPTEQKQFLPAAQAFTNLHNSCCNISCQGSICMLTHCSSLLVCNSHRMKADSSELGGHQRPKSCSTATFPVMIRRSCVGFLHGCRQVEASRQRQDGLARSASAARSCA